MTITAFNDVAPFAVILGSTLFEGAEQNSVVIVIVVLAAVAALANQAFTFWRNVNGGAGKAVDLLRREVGELEAKISAFSSSHYKARQKLHETVNKLREDIANIKGRLGCNKP